MSKDKIKHKENPVGATSSRPHFEGLTKQNRMPVGAESISARSYNGITLIALVISIIVMLILVGVTVTVAISGGVFDKTKESANKYDKAKDIEQISVAYSLQFQTEKESSKKENKTNKELFEDVKNNLDFEGATYNIASQFMNIVKEDGTEYTLLSDGTVLEGKFAYLDIADGTIQLKSNGYIQGENELEEYTGKYLITGTTTENTVKVMDIGTYDITIKDLNIDVSNIKSAAAFDANASKKNIGLHVTINIEGENKLFSGNLRTGLAFSGAKANMNGVTDGSTLTIEGDGYLEAVGGTWGAGIGGDCYTQGNNITINSGNIIARGGLHGAGIGTGLNGRTYCVTINGGNIKCYGNYSGPGIGLSDANPNYGAVTVNGGELYLTGPSCIGGRYLEEIIITGGIIYAEQVGSASSWRRAAFCADKIFIEGGTIVAKAQNVSAIFSSSGNINISGGNILANGVIPMGKVVQDEETSEEKLGEAIPTNGQNEVYLTPVRLPNIEGQIQITSLTTSDNIEYGIKDMYTMKDDESTEENESGMLYLYLPEGAREITISTKDKTYIGTINTTTGINEVVTLVESN